MGNRTAKFISALFAGIVAGMPLSAMAQTAPAAADECLASPKGTTPQGQHWYYRIERGTKRQCWYLRAEGAKDGSKAAAPTAQTAANTEEKAEQPAPRTLQDAHAELTSPQPAAAPDTTAFNAASNTVPAPPAAARPDAVADGSTQQTAGNGTVWPDPSTAAPQPAAQLPAPREITDTRPAKAAASPAPVPLAAAMAPADRPAGSLQTLALVIGAALALAGIIGSVIYHLAGARARKRRRRIEWDRWEQTPDIPRAPWADAAQAPRTPQPRELADELADTVRDTSARESVDGSANAPGVQQPRTTAAVDIDAFALEIEAIARRATSAQARQPADAPPVAAETEPAVVESSPETIATGSESPDDEVDIDVITRMLERLAQEGPRLDPGPDHGPGRDRRPDRPIAATGPGDFARSQRARSGVRA